MGQLCRLFGFPVFSDFSANPLQAVMPILPLFRQPLANTATPPYAHEEWGRSPPGTAPEGADDSYWPIVAVGAVRSELPADRRVFLSLGAIAWTVAKQGVPGIVEDKEMAGALSFTSTSRPRVRFVYSACLLSLLVLAGCQGMLP